ncbi:hypothetical protein MNBD_GAMMA16-1980 [hydrothermal vent metagenome]|uniref:Flagellar protein FliL n=1 Tax=hydrothermal vent metagenome TaxID=652676 RepID=A0A3B1A3M7_9ZZZZ
MADEPNADDSAESSEENKKPKKDKSGIIKFALISLGIVAIIGTNVGLTVMLTKKNSAEIEATMEPSAGKQIEKDVTADENEDESEKPALYQKLEPTFVVNFQSEDALRFLQVTVELMTRDEKIIAAVEQHMPIIRNNLIILFSSQDFTTISTRVGKERIRAQTLSEIQKVMKEKTGQPGVEEVYFTSFVMQ